MTSTEDQSMSLPQYSIAIRDYVQDIRTRYTAPVVQLPESTTSELTIHIGAPFSKGDIIDEGMHLYLDPENSQSRKLHERAWQAFYDAPVGDEGFHSDAQGFAHLMVIALLEEGLYPIDLTEVYSLLSQAEGKRITAWQCVGLEPLKPRLDSISAEHGWVAAFDFERKRAMRTYAMAGADLQEHLPKHGMLMATGNVYEGILPRLIMLTVAAV